MGTKYRKEHHKRAFELYCELGSFYAVSKEKGMPSRSTLLQWSNKSFKCECGYHGWDELVRQISRDVRERSELRDGDLDQTDQTGQQGVQSPLEQYIRKDLDKLKMNRMNEMGSTAAKDKAIKELRQGYSEMTNEEGKIIQMPLMRKEMMANLKIIREAEDIEHSGWREDRVILGEPTDGPQEIILTESEHKRRELAVYRMVKAQLEEKGKESEEER